MAQEHYKQIKNYIENELGISKETIGEVVSKILDRAVESHMEKYLASPQFNAKVNAALSYALTGYNSSNYSFGNISKEATEFIRKEVKDTLQREFLSKVNIYVSIDDPKAT